MSLAACRFPRGRVQSKCIHLIIFKRGHVPCAWDSCLHQAVDKHELSIAPPLFYTLDKTGHLFWLFDTFVPKTGRENSFCYTTTTYNSRQAHASFLNSRQLYEGRDRKISSFSFPTSCSKEGFRGKLMSSEAAKLRVKSHLPCD